MKNKRYGLIALLILFVLASATYLSRIPVSDYYLRKANMGRSLNAALPFYERAIFFNPSNSDAYLSRAHRYLGRGDLDDALIDINRAIELRPEYAYNYAVRGDIYREQGDLQSAVEEYDQAIARNSSDPGLFYERARLHDSLGNTTLAFADYNTFLSLDTLGGPVTSYALERIDFLEAQLPN